jgi:hypothetical protein
MFATLAIDQPTERLEAEVCSLAAQIAAATCRFLLLVAELDRREAWKEWGCVSMAQWLSWKCALSITAAREHVRVGRALEHLPRIGAAFTAGRLSYSKVRALTRVATPEREEELLEFATIATASQLDRTVRAFDRSRADGKTERARLERRRVRALDESDGTVTVEARLTREQFELVWRALDAAMKEVPRDRDTPAEARRADALQLVAEAFLSGRSDRVPTEVVLHVDGGDDLSPAVERSTCDTSLRVNGGRRVRTIPRALRRAIEHRDKAGCRFPGCHHTRFLHVHHIVHFARGGTTDDENCLLLCPFHHRLVHEGGWRVLGRANGVVEFVSPNGRRAVEDAERWPGVRFEPYPGLDPAAIVTAYGERLDLDLAVTALHTMFPPARS